MGEGKGGEEKGGEGRGGEGRGGEGSYKLAFSYFFPENLKQLPIAHYPQTKSSHFSRL